MNACAARAKLVPGLQARAVLFLLSGCIIAFTASGLSGQLPESSSDAERRAGDAIREYYASTARTATRRSVVATGESYTRPPACQGAELWDCFGGDLWCAWRATWCDPSQYTVERRALLASLDSLSMEYPTSDFVVGHLVDFALKDRDFEKASLAAERCRASRWWCQALRGYVRHRIQPGSGYLALDSAKVSAPDSTSAWGMPIPLAPDRGLHCEWSDIGLFVDADQLGIPRERSVCDTTHPLVARFWLLSDPLWSVPGNLRHDEHVVRYIRMRLLYQAELAIRTRPPSFSEPRPFWPQALTGQWTRMGFYNSWRTLVEIRGGEEVERTELYVDGGYSFMPDTARLLHPESSVRSDWGVERNRGEERLRINVAWHDVEAYQAVALLRDGSQYVAAAGRLPVVVDSFDGLRTSLAMMNPHSGDVEVFPAEVAIDGVVRASASVREGAWLASLELIGDSWHGRARHGVSQVGLDSDGFGLAQPGLVDPLRDEDLPLEQRLLPSTTVRQGPVGVYFEAYGLSQSESISVRVVLDRQGRSVFRRVLGALGLGSSDGAIEVGWDESVGVTPLPLTRQVSLDLGGVEEGAYTLSVEVTRDGGQSARSSRTLNVLGN